MSTLYSGKTIGDISAAPVRHYVAQHSGKAYFNNGTQQDAEEFLSSLEKAIFEELETFIPFTSIRNNHWGKEQIRKEFLDNPRHIPTDI